MDEPERGVYPTALKKAAIRQLLMTAISMSMCAVSVPLGSMAGPDVPVAGSLSSYAC